MVEWSTVVHMPQQFPMHAIGPVRMMWHPHQPDDSRGETEPQQLDSQALQTACPGGSSGGNQGMDIDDVQESSVLQTAAQQQQQQQAPQNQPNQQQQQQQHKLPAYSVQQGKLWMWSHAAYFAEVCATLSSCAQGTGVSVTSLCSSLRRIELQGAACDAALAKAVSSTAANTPAAAIINQRAQQEDQPDATPQQTARAPEGGSQALQAMQDITDLGDLPDGAVVGLTAVDPRLSKPIKGLEGMEAFNMMALPPVSTPATAAQPATMAAGTADRELMRQHQPGGTEHALLTDPDNIPGPLPEHVISSKRQQARQHLLGLDQISGSPAMKSSPHGITCPLLPSLDASGAGDTPAAAAESCPVLLVRRSYSDVGGWSLILPAGWVMPFWLALAYAGEAWLWCLQLQRRTGCCPIISDTS